MSAASPDVTPPLAGLRARLAAVAAIPSKTSATMTAVAQGTVWMIASTGRMRDSPAAQARVAAFDLWDKKIGATK